MYQSDLPWLRYSLLSIKKFLDPSNFLEIIIYAHDACVAELTAMINDVDLKAHIAYRIIPVHYDYHGYIKQMVVKCNCFRDVTTEYVMILDCDCILKRPLCASDYSGAPIEWRYLKKQDEPSNVVWSVWKKAFEDSTQKAQEVHYMANGFPFMFTTRSLAEAHEYFIKLHGCDYDTWCKNRMKGIDISGKITSLFSVLSKIFEEFEFLGYYCHTFSKEYTFVTTTAPSTKKDYLIQHWSHGGITPDIKAQIEGILNG